MNERKMDWQQLDLGEEMEGDRRSNKKIILATKMYESKDYSLSQIKEATGIGATTLYRYLGKKELSGEEV